MNLVFNLDYWRMRAVAIFWTLLLLKVGHHITWGWATIFIPSLMILLVVFAFPYLAHEDRNSRMIKEALTRAVKEVKDINDAVDKRGQKKS